MCRRSQEGPRQATGTKIPIITKFGSVKLQHSHTFPFVQKRRCGDTQRRFCTTRVYKPGSVLTAIYLVPQLLTGSSHLPEAVGPTYCFSTVLLRIEFTAPQCSHGAGALLPHLFTLTGRSPAVSLCCTCPEVALGGRYPLSLPYGARTFLTRSLSAFARGCPTRSRKYCTPIGSGCQMSCKFFLSPLY